MRVNVILNEDQKKDGYHNTLLDLSDIYDGEADEILLENIIEHFPMESFENIFKLLVTKLRKNGKLVIVTQDLSEATRRHVNGEIDIFQLNHLLYNQKNSGLNLDMIIEIYRDLGLEIESYYFDDLNLIITGRK